MGAPRRNTMHDQIARVLRDRIATGVYPLSEMLPPEMLLVTEFEVSRHTVREAMKALVNEGLIERVPGRGTVVAPPSKDRNLWGVKSIDDLVGEFAGNRIVVVKHGIVPVRDFPEVGALFSLRHNSSLYYIERIINGEEGPMAVNHVYTLPKYAAQIPADQIGYKPTMKLIETYCRIEAMRTRQVAGVASANAKTAKLLGVRLASPLLKLKRTYVDRQNAPIEYTELFFRSDRYEHTVDFLREKRPRARRLPTD
jgi:GntR family transcriptional regulator